MAKGIFQSSLTKKYVMAATGLFLISFLVVHAAINAMIFFNDGGKTFNSWGHFMGTNLIVRTMEIGLFAGLILHIVDGLVLFFQNRKARPVKYAYEKPNASSQWYSRSMAILGTLILLFLVIHLKDFWLKTRITELTISNKTIDIPHEGIRAENLFAEMQMVFSNIWVVAIYVLGCFSLFWHLLHGFRSAFQSMGWNYSKYASLIANTGDAFSVVISALFASMPIAMYLNLVH
jgi:succinate dehydrogenase / fumarate reductase cytochrome b subunit